MSKNISGDHAASINRKRDKKEVKVIAVLALAAVSLKAQDSGGLANKCRMWSVMDDDHHTMYLLGLIHGMALADKQVQEVRLLERTQ